MGTKEKQSEDLLMETRGEKLHEIVLYNDDHNTFDHVINTMMAVCDHTPEQAEQCSILVHYIGKCIVKTGSYKELEPQCSALLDADLTAEII